MALYIPAMPRTNKRDAKRFAKALHDAGVTDSEVAEVCGVTDRSPGNWRNGKAIPRQKAYLALRAFAMKRGVA